MKIVLLAEGKTEKKSLRAFLGRWLSPPRTPQSVRVDVIEFKGCARLANELQAAAQAYLHGPKSRDVLGVVGLLDLYGADFLDQRSSVPERYSSGKQQFEEIVGHPKFRMHFAVHEVEAWLLSQPELLPRAVRENLPSSAVQRPEEVNFTNPPAKLLCDLYRRHLSGNQEYKKATTGAKLLASADPALAAEKCPYLGKLLDDLLALAQAGDG